MPDWQTPSGSSYALEAFVACNRARSTQLVLGGAAAAAVGAGSTSCRLCIPCPMLLIARLCSVWPVQTIWEIPLLHYIKLRRVRKLKSIVTSSWKAQEKSSKKFLTKLQNVSVSRLAWWKDAGQKKETEKRNDRQMEHLESGTRQCAVGNVWNFSAAAENENNKKTAATTQTVKTKKTVEQLFGRLRSSTFALLKNLNFHFPPQIGKTSWKKNSSCRLLG